MKTKIKNLLFASIALLLALPSFSQKLIDKNTFQVNNSLTLKIGDDLVIGKPAAYDFVNIEEEKNKFSFGKIANIAGAAGSAVGLAGVQTGSIGAMETGIKAMNTASTVSSIGMTADAIKSLNASDKAKQIIGKKFRILKFKEDGNEKRGYHYYAVVAGEGKTNYRIEVIPAIQSQEVVGVNAILF
ncbi:MULTISPECIES: hypothetical protein [Chitinophagaceae]